MKKIFALISICLFAISGSSLMTGCSNIDDANRFTATHEDVTTDTIWNLGPLVNYASTVLVEDFTGQKCTWCPEGTRLLTQAQETYGEDRVIPVAIHSGSLGYAAPKGLMTDLGVYYWNKNGFNDQTSQPTAVFNRRTTSDDRATWLTTIANEIALKRSVGFNVQNAKRVGDEVSFDLHIKATSSLNAYLQLWLIENNIVGLQIDGGVTNKEYVHNHVLREAINGNDGEAISLSTNTQIKHFSYTIDSSLYAPENCEVVAFVYDDNGVEQAIKVKFEAEEE